MCLFIRWPYEIYSATIEFEHIKKNIVQNSWSYLPWYDEPLFSSSTFPVFSRNWGSQLRLAPLQLLWQSRKMFKRLSSWLVCEAKHIHKQTAGCRIHLPKVTMKIHWTIWHGMLRNKWSFIMTHIQGCRRNADWTATQDVHICIERLLVPRTNEAYSSLARQVRLISWIFSTSAKVEETHLACRRKIVMLYLKKMKQVILCVWMFQARYAFCRTSGRSNLMLLAHMPSAIT